MDTVPLPNGLGKAAKDGPSALGPCHPKTGMKFQALPDTLGPRFTCQLTLSEDHSALPHLKNKSAENAYTDSKNQRWACKLPITVLN